MKKRVKALPDPAITLSGGYATVDIASITSTTAMAAMVQQLQAVSEIQTAVMLQLAEGQRDLAAMLAAMGIGRNIDIHA